MKVLGVTGGSGTGKSTVCSLLEENYGAAVIDVDRIGHDIIKCGKPAYNEILRTFGEQILDENREIQRKALGSIVFGDKLKLESLNEITFKYMTAEVEQLIRAFSEAGKELAVIDCAILFQMGLQSLCDDVWTLEAGREQRIRRITMRDRVPEDYARSRIESQHGIGASSKTIYNNGEIADLKIQVDKRLKELTG